MGSFQCRIRSLRQHPKSGPTRYTAARTRSSLEVPDLYPVSSPTALAASHTVDDSSRQDTQLRMGHLAERDAYYDDIYYDEMCLVPDPAMYLAAHLDEISTPQQTMKHLERSFGFPSSGHPCIESLDYECADPDELLIPTPRYQWQSWAYSDRSTQPSTLLASTQLVPEPVKGCDSALHVLEANLQRPVSSSTEQQRQVPTSASLDTTARSTHITPPTTSARVMSAPRVPLTSETPSVWHHPPNKSSNGQAPTLYKVRASANANTGKHPRRLHSASFKAQRQRQYSRHGFQEEPAADAVTQETAFQAITAWKQLVTTHLKLAGVDTSTDTQEITAGRFSSFQLSDLSAGDRRRLQAKLEISASTMDALHTSTQSAIHYLYTSHTNAVLMVANQVTRPNTTIRQDAKAIATLLLHESFWLFEHSRGASFLSFAIDYMKRKTCFQITHQLHAIPCSRHFQAVRMKLLGAVRHLFDGDLERLSDIELAPAQISLVAEHLDMSATTITNALALSESQSVGDFCGSEAKGLPGVESDCASYSGDAHMLQMQRAFFSEFDGMMQSVLKPKDVGILEVRYGLKSGVPLNNIEAAKLLGLSRTAGHMRLKKALGKLTKATKENNEYLTLLD